MTARPHPCDSCGDGPCHDGTLCNGGRTVATSDIRRGVLVFDSIYARAFDDHFEARSAFLGIIRDLEHPKHQEQPRSPKPGFKKGRR